MGFGADARSRRRDGADALCAAVIQRSVAAPLCLPQARKAQRRPFARPL